MNVKMCILILAGLTGGAMAQTMPGLPTPADSVTGVSDTLLAKDLRTDPALQKWKSMLVDSVSQAFQQQVQSLRDSLNRVTDQSGNRLQDEYDRFLEERYFNYLEHLMETKEEKVLFGLFAKSNPQLSELKIAELRRYLDLFPPGARNDQVLAMLGDTYAQSGLDGPALGAYLKIVLVFPNSEIFTETQSKAIKLASESVALRSRKADIVSYLSGGVLHEGYESNYLRYLEFLNRLQIRDMADWYFGEMSRYIRQFPRSEALDDIHLWTAKMYQATNQYEKAAYAYTKVQYLAPGSPIIPLTYFELGNTYRNPLKQYNKAVTAFQVLAREFPSDSLAIPALWEIADLYTEETREYTKAVNAYQQVIDRYPEDPRAIDAYFAQAKLYAGRLDQPTKAVDRYLAVTKSYADKVERSGTAFVRAADIYADVIKDYYTAVDMYIQFAQRYSKHPEVPNRLVKAAELSEDRLADYNQAIDLLELVEKNYPGSDAAKKSAKKLSKLRERVTGSE